VEHRAPSTSHHPDRLPGNVWALGFVSLLMDASSELVRSLLPMLMVTVLGLSMMTVGLVEGLAEATASMVKVVSGTLSDRWRRRKALVIAGYGLSAMSKPVFPLAQSAGWIIGARCVDRVGKGIRGAPRDALVADITPPHLRGAAFGLRQALDSVGAVVGPLLAVVLVTWLGGNIRAALWFAVVPGALSVALLALAVREPETPSVREGRPPIILADLHALPRRYWLVVGVGVVFTLARFSEAFLVLRAQNVGMAVAHVPFVMVVMSAVYAAGAYPSGAVADRIGARALLTAGLVILVCADLILAGARDATHVLIGAGCWGLHMAFTQGLFSKLVADTASSNLRGTAFGIFNLAVGGALLAASVIAGALWSTVGPQATFWSGAGLAGLAAAGVIGYRPRR